MVTKAYAWADGAPLDDHTERKHKILREYFFRYITVRCEIPQQTKFRLAVVDGFPGAGRYRCGSPGSPIIFIEELQRALEAVNLQRAAQGPGPVVIECLLIFNDAKRDVTELLKAHCAPVVAAAKETCPKLHLQVGYMSEDFEAAYPAIRDLVAEGRYRNVLFNLDQCGHSAVERPPDRLSGPELCQLDGGDLLARSEHRGREFLRCLNPGRRGAPLARRRWFRLPADARCHNSGVSARAAIMYFAST